MSCRKDRLCVWCEDTISATCLRQKYKIQIVLIGKTYKKTETATGKASGDCLQHKARAINKYCFLSALSAGRKTATKNLKDSEN